MDDDAAYLELLASYEAALDAPNRTMRIAQAFADAHASGRRLPETVATAYCAQLDRDDEQLGDLREKVPQFKAMLRTH